MDLHKEILPIKDKLEKLQTKITKCKKCPRLVEYIDGIREKYPTYFCKPVPSFGGIDAEILIIGLAPGRFGSNRTGRMFTGDSSGNFMYPVLYETGLCTQPDSTDMNDGLELINSYITAVGHCAPPQNKPTREELENCFPFFEEEMKLLKDVKVIVALGKIAFDGYLKWAMENEHIEKGLKKKDFQFSHGATYNIGNHVLIASYHPSRQNTQTGRLTKKMFKSIFQSANKHLKKPIGVK